MDTILTLTDLKKLKKNDLIQVARKYGIVNPYALKKNELVERINASIQKNIPPAQQSSKKVTRSADRLHKETDKIQSPPLTAIQQSVHEPTVTYEPETKEEAYEQRPVFRQWELPNGYNVTKLIGMVRDPYWVYLYWDFDGATNNRIGELYKSYGEGLYPIIRIYEITNILFNGSNANKFWDVEINLDARNWYLYLGEPDKSFIFDIGLVDYNGTFYLLARSNVIRMPLDGPSHIVDERWMSYDFEELYTLSGGFAVGISSGELKRKKHITKPKEWITSGMVSSPGMNVPKEQAREFFLEVATELILYGRTKPDAQVTVEGKPVKLRQDGTFTLRYHLPNGHYALPVKATSGDGIESRMITIDVTRDAK